MKRRLALILFALPLAHAQDAWDMSGAAGLSITDGNSSSLAYSLQVLATYESGQNEARLAADYFFSEENGSETTNAASFSAQYNRLISDRFYFGIVGDLLTDDVADITYRADLALVAGYYFVKNTSTSLSFEAGPGMTWEEQGGERDSFASLRLAERFEHQLTDQSKVWQSLVWTPEVGDFSSSLMTFEFGMDTRLHDSWSLRTFLRHEIDSTPAAGEEREDTSILIGLAYTLGGLPEKSASSRETLKKPRKAASADPQGWDTTLSATASLAQGNSESTRVAIGIESAYRNDTRESFLDLAYLFGEDAQTTTADQLRAAARYNQKLSRLTFLSYGITYLRDDVADVAYRVTPNFALGRYLVKDDTLTLSVEAGPGYVFEEVGGVTDDYLSYIAAERLIWAINDRTKFKQDVVLNAAAADLDNLTIAASATLDTAITDDLSLRAGLTYLFDNQPAAGRERSDTTFTTGLAISF